MLQAYILVVEMGSLSFGSIWLSRPPIRPPSKHMFSIQFIVPDAPERLNKNMDCVCGFDHRIYDLHSIVVIWHVSRKKSSSIQRSYGINFPNNL
jgi:hypothetical protein